MQKNQIKIGKKTFTVKKEFLKQLALYKHNKKQDVKSEIKCAWCGDEIIKKNISHAFCDLQCKDDFWNKIDPRKRNSKRTSATNHGKMKRYSNLESHYIQEYSFHDWSESDYHGGGH